MLRYIPYAIAVVLIVGVTIAHGLRTDRFIDSTTAEEMAFYIKDIPLDFGDKESGDYWEGEDQAVSRVAIIGTNAVGDVFSRRYTHKQTGKSVLVWLICGNVRDMINHTPNICNPNQGYDQQGEATQYSFGAEEDASYFRAATFLKDDYHMRQNDRVFWAWSSSPQWKGSDSPRDDFTNDKAIYKMYFTSITMPGERLEDSPNVAFGNAFLPVVNKALYSHRDQSDEKKAGNTSQDDTAEKG